MSGRPGIARLRSCISSDTRVIISTYRTRKIGDDHAYNAGSVPLGSQRYASGQVQNIPAMAMLLRG
jgi:hypothetical protein